MNFGHSIGRLKGLAPYALLNIAACGVLAASLPYVAREGAETAIAFTTPVSLPKAPNLVELREAHAVRRPAPTADMLARLPQTALPSVPLTASTKVAVVELISETPTEARPLAAALDSAESLPVKPLRPLHKMRYRALLADLSKRDAQRRAMASKGSAVQDARLASTRAQRAKRRELLAYTAGLDESTGAIVHRNFTTAVAALDR